MATSSGVQAKSSSSNRGRWLLWFVGTAVLAAVIAAAIHYSEEREFLLVMERARPIWLLWALLLQAGTYAAQGEIWLWVARLGKSPLDFKTAFQLSLAKLFVDQAVPTSGISGTVVQATALEQRDMPRPIVMAGVIVNTASFFLSFAAGLIATFAILALTGQSHLVVTIPSLAFTAFSIAFAVGMLALAGRDLHLHIERFSRYAFLQRLLGFVQDADGPLTRCPRLMLVATGLQVATILLDVATLEALVRSVGGSVAAGPVFASFMIASVVRTAGVIPGGLGTFEATSVFMLRMFRTPFSVALSATLLFRGISFWLPMIPGLWYSRKAVRPEAS